ncbi:FMN-linked oxidoreductase [Mycena vulgaris]|nr:FMN-linked oxidoreductase [Mycena vulgaris]
MSPQLFQSVNIGPFSLNHRVVLCPLTRLKADANHVPFLPLVKDYYTQRASTPGTLLIAESTLIAAKAGGFPDMPGIWSRDHINAWKEVVEAVHAKGSSIFLQLLALGRSAFPATLKSDDPTFPFVSGSDIPIVEGDEKPRSLTVSEIKEYVGLYAGFDSVEMHNANGCILDQFIQDVSNNRTDAYGSEAKRARFSLEVIKAVAEVVGEDRTAIRFSPWSPLGGMSMTNPIPTFSHIVSEIKRGYTRETAIKLAERKNALVACGRTFIANPDLPLCLEKNIPLHPYDRSTFYLPGQNVPTRYTHRPFATQQES